MKRVLAILGVWLCLSQAQGMMGEEDGRPAEHFCPITMAIMRDPVVASDGNTYERSAIAEWLQRKDTSPLTNQRIDPVLVPNISLRKLIEDWRADAVAQNMSTIPPQSRSEFGISTSSSSSIQHSVPAILTTEQNPSSSSASSSSSSSSSNVLVSVLQRAVKPLFNLFRSVSSSIEIPEIARGYEEVYRCFLGGQLIYRPGGDGDDTGMITLKVADLANPLEGTFDLSRCGDTGQYLSISTGYRKGKISANEDKVEIWFTPWFVANAVKDTLPRKHYLRIVTTPDKWDPVRAPVGIFWTWGGWDDLSFVDYLVTQDMKDLGSKNLHEAERGRAFVRGLLPAGLPRAPGRVLFHVLFVS